MANLTLYGCQCGCVSCKPWTNVCLLCERTHCSDCHTKFIGQYGMNSVGGLNGCGQCLGNPANILENIVPLVHDDGSITITIPTGLILAPHGIVLPAEFLPEQRRDMLSGLFRKRKVLNSTDTMDTTPNTTPPPS